MSRDHQQSRSSGRHFAPSSLLPYGGFGDPSIKHLHWRRTDDIDDDRFALAQAQDRFVRRLRARLLEDGITEDQLERDLGYPKRGLQRKLNGHELVTMRDVIRISQLMGLPVLAALVPDDAHTEIVREDAKRYSRTTARPTTPEDEFHAALQFGVDSLLEAAQRLRQLDGRGTGASVESLAETLTLLAKAANAVGAGIAARKHP
jgi:hypothetical protein